MTARFTIGRVAVNDEFPNLHVNVLFNGRSAEEWVLGPSRKGHDREVAVSPGMLNDDRQLKVTFEIARSKSPGQRGQPLDPGLEGFRVTHFRISPGQPRPTYHLGETIDFAEGENAADYLAPRWTEPDRHGRWTEGHEAGIALLLEKPIIKNVTAHLLVSDWMVGPSASSLPIRVSVNGSSIEDWVLGPDRTPHVRCLEIPAELLAGRTDLLVAFTLPDPRSPAALGLSNDTRPLGMRLTRAVVMRAGAPSKLFTEASQLQPVRK
jgi:hypothetical protein